MNQLKIREHLIIGFSQVYLLNWQLNVCWVNRTPLTSCRFPINQTFWTGGTQIGSLQGSNPWYFISGTDCLFNCELTTGKNQQLLKYFGHLKYNTEPRSGPHIVFIHRPGEQWKPNTLTGGMCSRQCQQHRNSIIRDGMWFKGGEKGWRLCPVMIYLCHSVFLCPPHGLCFVLLLVLFLFSFSPSFLSLLHPPHILFPLTECSCRFPHIIFYPPLSFFLAPSPANSNSAD